MRSLEEILGAVESEGLEYTIYDYYGPELGSESAKLNDAWKKAFDAMNEIYDILYADQDKRWNK
jgi:hypothetical protein